LAATHKSERIRCVTGYLQELVRDIAELAAVPEHETSFLDAGLDSLMLVELSTQLQIEVGPETELPPTLAFDYPRISSMAEFLLRTIYPTETTTPPDSGSQHEPSNAKPPAELYSEVERMSEEDALRELLKELND
jgi:acyl carrier protein